MRPDEELELAPADAAGLGVSDGDEVTVGSEGVARRLRARLAPDLPAGSVRLPRAAAAELGEFVEVRP
jgi:anaerobic selenocysteine-containing dehydrogenase